MTEPTGRTIDGRPWEEPRPPHLPDPVRSLTPWVLPFLLVALYQFWLLWTDQPREGDLATRVQFWFGSLSQFGGILASLIGLALFARHPNARSTLPQMASGAFLLLLQQVLRLLQPALDPVFQTLTPPSDDLSFVVLAAQFYAIAAAIVGVFGIAFLASGLSAARRFESQFGVRSIAVPLVVVALVSTAFSILSFTTGGFELSPSVLVLIVSSVLVNLFATLASAYLFVVAVVGWLGHEGPRAGWGLAAVGAGLNVLALVLDPIIVVLPVSQESLIGAYDLLRTGSLIGDVLLVVALAIGLPSTVSVPDDLGAEPTLDQPGATLPGSAAG